MFSLTRFISVGLDRMLLRLDEFVVSVKRRHCKEPYYICMNPASGLFTYYEGDRIVVVCGEMMARPPNFLIYAKTLQHWLPPHEDEPIDEEKKQEILSRVGECLTRQRASYEIVDT